MTETIIITGGAGFVGSNAASRFLRRGNHVVVIDNLSRKGSQRNLEWLCPQGRIEFCETDIRDADQIERIFHHHSDAAMVLHLAAQVAVTTSVTDPREDFEINAVGSFNVLEAARKAKMYCPIIYASTNKVYGGLEDMEVREGMERYCFADQPWGVSEQRPLDFHSPYGCSKGAADQYFRDYHRIYGLNTVVARQSCVYGYRQFGVEDQGWVAWFLIAAELGKEITVYGDGKQVRDILFVDDLVDAYEAMARRWETSAGQVYNVGGGPGNAISLLQLLAFLKEAYPDTLQCLQSGWRPGDQRIYVSDIRRAAEELNWRPRIQSGAGLARLHAWVGDNRELFDV